MPDSPPALDVRWRALVRDLVRHSPNSDPREIAAEAMARLSDAEAAEVARDLLPMAVREELGNARRHALRPDGAPRSPRWERAALSVARFCVAGVWRPLTELTPADLEVLAGEYDERAAQNAAWAQAMRGLAAMVKRTRGAATVGDLDPDAVRALMPEES